MPTLTPHDDMDPSPRVDILFTAGELSPAVTITVLQVSNYGEVPVRGAIGVLAAGGFAITDTEVPLGVEVAYRAVKYDGAGLEIGVSPAATVQIDIDINTVIVQDPLAPRDVVAAQAEVDMAGKLQRSRDRQVYQIGTSTRTISGPLGLMNSVAIRMFTETEADGELLEDILGEPSFLVRSMPPMPISRLFYGSVADVGWIPFDARFGGYTRVWDLVADEVSRSNVEIVEPLVTYQRYMDAYGTYSDAMAVYSTYLDAELNPPAEA